MVTIPAEDPIAVAATSALHKGRVEDLQHVLSEQARLASARLARTPTRRRSERGPLFTDGRRAMWEYPRSTAAGEQMDFVEVMDIDGGRIRSHRVYWGWSGVALLAHD